MAGHKVLTDTQLKTIAWGSVKSKSLEVVCKSVDESKGTVERVMRGEFTNARQEALYASYIQQANEQINMADIRHQTEMSQMTDRAYQTVRQALCAFDAEPKLATETAWKVLQNAGFPVFNEKTGLEAGQVNTQINYYNNPKAAAAFETVLASVTKTTEAMTSPLGPVGAPSRHIRTSEAEVVTKHPTEDQPIVVPPTPSGEEHGG